MHFKIRYIMESTYYYLGNELVQVGNNIHTSLKKYSNEVLRTYQKTQGNMKKQVLPMLVKEHPELDDSPILNEKQHKDFHHIIGMCQCLIVAGRFDLSYSVSTLSRFLTAPQVGNIDLTRRIFGFLNNYPKIKCAINPHLLTTYANYEKFHRKYDF